MSSKKQLHNTILAKHTADTFKRLLDFELGKRLDHLAKSADFPTQVYEVLDSAEREGWLDQLAQLISPTPHKATTAPKPSLTHQRLQRQLADKQEEHTAVCEQERGALDPTAKIRLQRQIEKLEAEIAEIERQLSG